MAPGENEIDTPGAGAVAGSWHWINVFISFLISSTQLGTSGPIWYQAERGVQ